MNKRTVIICTVIFCIVSVAIGLPASVYAWIWPSQALALSADFASANQGSFLSGVWLKLDGKSISAIEDGDLVIKSASISRHRSRIPFNSRAAVLLQHAQGFRSLYSLEKLNGWHHKTWQASEPYFAKKGGELVSWSPAADSAVELFFAIQDSKNGGFVNPLTVLPLFKDDRAPVLQSLQFAWKNESLNQLVSQTLKPNSDLVARNYQVLVHARDSLALVSKQEEQRPSIGLPLEMTLSIDGKSIYDFSRYQLIADPQSRSLVYAWTTLPTWSDIMSNEQAVNAGWIDLKPGFRRLELGMSDAYGWRSSARMRLVVSDPNKSP